jgi:Short C-terminal domain
MGFLGFIGMIIGFGFMVGYTPGISTSNGMTIGIIVFGSGTLITCVGAWKEVADRKEKRLKREATIDQVERLADLWKQGALTDEEFALQKREPLKLADPQPAWLAEVPLSNPTTPETPVLARIGQLVELWERGALDDDEFAAFKRPFLDYNGTQPTQGDEAGLAHIKGLATLWESGTISDEEFTEQKQRVLRMLDSRANQLERDNESKPKVPSAWDDLGEP